MVGIYNRKCEAGAVFETVRRLQNGHLTKGKEPQETVMYCYECSRGGPPAAFWPGHGMSEDQWKRERE